MITLSDDTIIDAILAREGATYTNRASDRGGPTKFGITEDTLTSYRGRACSPADVEALEEPEARAIYRFRYIQQPGFARVGDAQLRALLVDCGVLHGQDRAAKWLQHVLGVAEDGALGDVTLGMLRARDPRRVWLDVFAERISFIGRIITKNTTDADHDGIPDNAEMAWGWMNRCADILRGFTV